MAVKEEAPTLDPIIQDHKQAVDDLTGDDSTANDDSTNDSNYPRQRQRTTARQGPCQLASAGGTLSTT
jgi:hypothetical protein